MVRAAGEDSHALSVVPLEVFQYIMRYTNSSGSASGKYHVNVMTASKTRGWHLRWLHMRPQTCDLRKYPANFCSILFQGSHAHTLIVPVRPAVVIIGRSLAY